MITSLGNAIKWIELNNLNYYVVCESRDKMDSKLFKTNEKENPEENLNRFKKVMELLGDGNYHLYGKESASDHIHVFRCDINFDFGNTLQNIENKLGTILIDMILPKTEVK